VRLYSQALAQTPHVLLLAKRDLWPPGEPLPAVHAPDAAGVLGVSSAAGTGLEELKEFLWKFVEETKTVPSEASGFWEFMDDE
jgi:hypothetical protein